MKGSVNELKVRPILLSIDQSRQETHQEMSQPNVTWWYRRFSYLRRVTQPHAS